MVNNTFILKNLTDERSLNWTTDDILELKLGIIISSINDIYDGRKSLEQRNEALDWFLAEHWRTPFSIVNCCDSVGLDVVRLRFLVDQLTKGALNYDPNSNKFPTHSEVNCSWSMVEDFTCD